MKKYKITYFDKHDNEIEFQEIEDTSIHWARKFAKEKLANSMDNDIVKFKIILL
jgi:hypothetical protein